MKSLTVIFSTFALCELVFGKDPIAVSQIFSAESDGVFGSDINSE